MALIEYLTGGEAPTATLMNRLFHGEAPPDPLPEPPPDPPLDLMAGLETKLSRLLGGKSFLLAQDAVFSRRLFGKAFFFTSGPTIYSQRAPGFVDLSGGVARPYNHTQFTNAVAGISPTGLGWDDANRIVTVPPFSAPLYAGLTPYANVGVLDYSLQAHTLPHQAAGDPAPVPYFIYEPYRRSWERKYHYALAEIILEGVTALTFPAEWDKYNCFRVHNLNMTPATVSFAGGFTLELGPLECWTVRRDNVTTNYRKGGHYFFEFEPGDPRFCWYLPVRDMGGNESNLFTGSGGAGGESPSATMVANNLTNPMGLLDWVQYFERTLGSQATGTQYAGWRLDPATQCAVEWSASRFGDPNNPATLLGDLMHHQGDIKILRTHKTQVDEAGQPVRTEEVLRFNGYGSIVPDFAAKLITVTQNGSGRLVISANDPDYYLSLVPISTNLFKQGEVQAATIHLSRATPFGATPYTLEAAVFEHTVGGALGQSAPYLLRRPVIVEELNQQVYGDYFPGGAVVDNPVTTTVTGPPVLLLYDGSRTTGLVVNSLHLVTVAELLTLDYWGDASVPGQNTTYRTYTNRKLQLTPEGLVLTFTQNETQVTRAIGGAVDYGQWATGQLANAPKAIQFRGHGWGYVSPTEGSQAAPFLASRVGRYEITAPWIHDLFGPEGKDFELNPALTGSETETQILTRLATSSYQRPSSAHRFFIRPVGARQVVPALLQEQYNHLARYVNAIKEGWPLDWRTLRWNVGGTLVGLNNGIPAGNSIAAPMEEFCNFSPTSAMNGLCALLNIPVRTYLDFPDGEKNGARTPFAELSQKRNIPMVLAVRRKARVTGVSWNVMATGVDVEYARLSGTVNATTEVLPAPANTDPLAPLQMFGATYNAAGLVGAVGRTRDNYNLNPTGAGFSYANYRWIKLADVRAVVEALGFEFNHVETLQPLTLCYTEEILQAGTLFAQESNEAYSNIGWVNQGYEHLPAYDLTAIYWDAYGTGADWYMQSYGSGITIGGSLLPFTREEFLADVLTKESVGVSFVTASGWHASLRFATVSDPARARWKRRVYFAPQSISRQTPRGGGGAELDLQFTRAVFTHDVKGAGSAPDIGFSPPGWTTGSSYTQMATAGYAGIEWRPADDLENEHCYSDYVQIGYTPGRLADQIEVVGFQVFGDRTQSVPLIGRPHWTIPTGWWREGIVQFSLASGNNLAGRAPWVAVDPPDSSATITPGISIIAAPEGTRYLALFDPAFPPMDLRAPVVPPDP
jgi:hypothetical protein